MPISSTPFSLRIPCELLDRLKALARRNKRSANRELEQILEEYILQWEAENGALPHSPQ
ncbi:MAG: Arc family DNA-binding protein [Oscillospiraceae bacterium]